MDAFKFRLSPLATAALASALVVLPAIRAQAGPESSITNPEAAAPAAAPASPAKTESPAAAGSEEEPHPRRHDEPEKKRTGTARHTERGQHADPAPAKVGCVPDRFGYSSQSGTAESQCR